MAAARLGAARHLHARDAGGREPRRDRHQPGARTSGAVPAATGTWPGRRFGRCSCSRSDRFRHRSARLTGSSGARVTSGRSRAGRRSSNVAAAASADRARVADGESAPERRSNSVALAAATQEHEVHHEREENEDREHRNHFTSHSGRRQEITKGAGYCEPGHQGEHGSRPRITSDDDRDRGCRGDEEGPGQRQRGEGLVVEKVPPEGRAGRRDGGLPGEGLGEEQETRQQRGRVVVSSNRSLAVTSRTCDIMRVRILSS